MAERANQREPVFKKATASGKSKQKKNYALLLSSHITMRPRLLIEIINNLSLDIFQELYMLHRLLGKDLNLLP